VNSSGLPDRNDYNSVMSQPKLRDLIDEFCSRRKIDTTVWQITETSKSLLVSNIEYRTHAGLLHEFLAAHGLLTTTIRGNKAGTTWGVVGRTRREDSQPDRPKVTRRRPRRLARRRKSGPRAAPPTS
jgi:hypothetical protein